MDIFSNPPKVHGRVLWANPITISHFLYVSHWYWDVGRPEWVSGTTPTTAPYSPSGWQSCPCVGYRNTPVWSLNQYQIDLGFGSTSLHSRRHTLVLSLLSESHRNSYSPPERSIFLNRIIPVQTLTQINQSGLHIYWFILLNIITQMAGFTSHISPEYVLYSPHSSTDHIWSIFSIILVVYTRFLS